MAARLTEAVGTLWRADKGQRQGRTSTATYVVEGAMMLRAEEGTEILMHDFGTCTLPVSSVNTPKHIITAT